MFGHIENICSPNQKDRFICPGVEVLGTSSIIVSVIGPELMFSKGQIYTLTEALLFFFLFGVGAPLVAWIIQQAYPNSFLRYVNPLIFNGPGLIPPATALNYVPAAGVGFFFQYWIRRQVLPYSLSLWTKYNYVLAIGLDSGVAFTFLVISLHFSSPKTIGAKNILVWWGNTIPFSGADYGPQGAGTPVQTLAPGDKFGYTSRRHRC
ncbi:OPT oligopeptide transporter protein-domain-containing protein [Mycena olivaceomarginata]|nr:OPT oligopeptide transporter protein-domain-containing protein [Mycena olivaceomarginata]